MKKKRRLMWVECVICPWRGRRSYEAVLVRPKPCPKCGGDVVG